MVTLKGYPFTAPTVKIIHCTTPLQYSNGCWDLYKKLITHLDIVRINRTNQQDTWWVKSDWEHKMKEAYGEEGPPGDGRSDGRQIFADILQRVKSDPRKFTYIGIGSCPQVTFEEFTDRWDQIIPVFVRDKGDRIRIVHFDPGFSTQDKVDFVQKYLTTKHLRMQLRYEAATDEKPYHYWISESGLLELIISQQSFDYEEPRDVEFLTSLCEHSMSTGGRLALQDYTGRKPMQCFRSLYANTQNRDLFRKKIIFDIEYGDGHCWTDMSIARPIYDASGDFINIVLFNHEEIEKQIGKNRRFDVEIFRLYKDKFKASMNEHHPNYRQRIKGLLCSIPSTYYDGNTEPAVILEVLVGQLEMCIYIFNKLGITIYNLRFRKLVDGVHEIEMYEWYTKMMNLIKHLE